MSKLILIDSYFKLVRTAIIDNGNLVDYYEEIPDQAQEKGNIYRGRVKRVEKNIQAAFIQYGGRRDGFLPLRDTPRSGSDAKQEELKPGNFVLVQVAKDTLGEKGAGLTTRISLAGRYLVYMPGQQGDGGISARVKDDAERKEMRDGLRELKIPPDGFVILRSAATKKPLEVLQSDLDRLVEAYARLRDNFDRMENAGLVHREAALAIRYLREYYTDEIEKVVVNNEETREQCGEFFQLYHPEALNKLVLSRDGPLLFQQYRLEEPLDRLHSPKISLKSGATIVIEQTEALVSVDVNSAKVKSGSRIEETAFAVNKEAAEEICRQLRLRDLGGIIVIDFIDMEDPRHKQEIETLMRQLLTKDKAKTKTFELTPLGTMLVGRQRLRSAERTYSQSECASCHGSGWRRSPATLSLTVLRKIEDYLRKRKGLASLSVQVSLPVSNYLMNELRGEIHSMESRHGVEIYVRGALVAETEGDEGIEIEGVSAKTRRDSSVLTMETASEARSTIPETEDPLAFDGVPVSSGPRTSTHRRQGHPIAVRDPAKDLKVKQAGNKQVEMVGDTAKTKESGEVRRKGRGGEVASQLPITPKSGGKSDQDKSGMRPEIDSGPASEGSRRRRRPSRRRKRSPLDVQDGAGR